MKFISSTCEQIAYEFNDIKEVLNGKRKCNAEDYKKYLKYVLSILFGFLLGHYAPLILKLF